VNRRRFDNRAEGFCEVNTRALCESPKNPPRLIPFQSAVSGELVLEDPLSSDNIGLAGTRHQVPSMIHKAPTVRLRHRRQGSGSEEGGNTKTVLSLSRHGVLVDDGGHGDGTRGQWRRRRCRGWRCRRAGSTPVDLRDDVLRWRRTRWQAGRPVASPGGT
jgi:hypothetical protein